MFYMTHYVSELGDITLVSDETNLIGLWIQGQKQSGMYLLTPIVEHENIPILTTAKKWLDRYFAGQNPDTSVLPVAPVGTSFQQEVWRVLRTIPYGQTTTYGEIARIIAPRVGRVKMSAQAVGGAVGCNPISIIIPCHRVIGAHGCLTGYAGGLDKKIKLLHREGVDVSRLKMPVFKN